MCSVNYLFLIFYAQTRKFIANSLWIYFHTYNQNIWNSSAYNIIEFRGLIQMGWNRNFSVYFMGTPLLAYSKNNGWVTL